MAVSQSDTVQLAMSSLPDTGAALRTDDPCWASPATITEATSGVAHALGGATQRLACRAQRDIDSGDDPYGLGVAVYPHRSIRSHCAACMMGLFPHRTRQGCHW